MRLSELTPVGGGVAPVVVFVDAPITAHISLERPQRAYYTTDGTHAADPWPLRTRVRTAAGVDVPTTHSGGYIMAGPVGLERGYNLLYLVADPALSELSEGVPDGAVVSAQPWYRPVADHPYPVQFNGAPAVRKFEPPNYGANGWFTLHNGRHVGPAWDDHGSHEWRLHSPDALPLPSLVTAGDGPDSWPLGGPLDVAVADGVFGQGAGGGLCPDGVVMVARGDGYALVTDADGNRTTVRVHGRPVGALR